ncbi:hypothetical protein JCM8097_008426 [Rhodosporidiobolus ruineniae]
MRASVDRLNIYRWYPRSKVLVLSPTRPLVSQQIKACHCLAGIPQSDCIELTGSTLPKLRSVGGRPSASSTRRGRPSSATSLKDGSTRAT